MWNRSGSEVRKFYFFLLFDQEEKSYTEKSRDYSKWIIEIVKYEINRIELCTYIMGGCISRNDETVSINENGSSRPPSGKQKKLVERFQVYAMVRRLSLDSPIHECKTAHFDPPTFNLIISLPHHPNFPHTLSFAKKKVKKKSSSSLFGLWLRFHILSLVSVCSFLFSSGAIAFFFGSANSMAQEEEEGPKRNLFRE